MKHEGKIERVKTREKSYSIMIDGVWFGGFYVEGKLPEAIKEGNVVSIEYIQEDNFNNIKEITFIKETKQDNDLNIKIGHALKQSYTMIAEDDEERKKLIKGDMTNYGKLAENFFKANKQIEEQLRRWKQLNNMNKNTITYQR